MDHNEKLDKSLSPHEHALADFVENAMVGLHWVAADGIILWANQAELELLGYTRDEYIGHHIAEFHADQATIKDILTRLTDGEKLSNYEARLRRKDGSIKQVLISSSVRFEDDKFIHTRCFTIDITERKQAADRILLLYRLTSAFSEAVTLQEVAQVIIEQALPLIDASSGTVLMLKKNQTLLEVLATTEAMDIPQQQFPIEDKGMLAESVRQQQPIWLSRLEEFQAPFPVLNKLIPKVAVAEAAVPLLIEKRVIGILTLRFSTLQSFDDKERQFIVALAQQCALALERVRLSEEARDIAVLEERQRLARDLHDSVSQSLFSIYTIAQALPRLWERDQTKAKTYLAQLATTARGATAEMRTLLLELRPASLVRSSLQELFTQLIDSIQARKTIEVTTQVDFKQVLPEDVHIALYRIVQESLNNISKHSDATEGRVFLTSEADQLVLRIQDNGRGFDMRETAAGLGLGVMRERAIIIGATFDVSSHPNHGTEIIVKWTLPEDMHSSQTFPVSK